MLARVARWIPALVYMTLIFYSSSQSDPAPALTNHIWDKLLHGAGYGVLALLYVWALAEERLAWTSMATLAVLLTSAYAASDEFHQAFTPGRMPDVKDWLADSVGAIIAVSAAAASTALRRPRPLQRSRPGR
jgi:VanZ family protein